MELVVRRLSGALPKREAVALTCECSVRPGEKGQSSQVKTVPPSAPLQNVSLSESTCVLYLSILANSCLLKGD